MLKRIWLITVWRGIFKKVSTCHAFALLKSILGLGSKIAYIWEGNEPGDQMTITYQELLDQVVKFAEVLRTKGVKKGDVVAIYLPMTIELPIALLACARIGALHSVVFAGFR